jgi:hypothetical protein
MNRSTSLRTALASLAALGARGGSVAALGIGSAISNVPRRFGFSRSRYSASGPILAGAAKCAKKGHRGKVTDSSCTRCR